jgi:hypothetical protein
MSIDLTTKHLGRVRDPIIWAPLAVLAGCGLLLVVNPATGIYPPCPSQVLFGIDCPLCGGLRATSSLLEGDFGSFIGHNALLAVVYPLLIAYWVLLIIQKRNPQVRPLESPAAQRAVILGGIVTIVVFTVLRNLFPYLGSGIS